MKDMTTTYYHAGCGTESDIRHWSDHTRRTREAAEREARAMARKHGGRGVVEYWPARCGLRPANQDVVQGADWVD